MNAYSLGKWIGSNPRTATVGGILVALGIFSGLSPSVPSTPPRAAAPAPKPVVANPDAELAAKRAQCNDQALPTAKGEAQFGKMMAARATLDPCRHLIVDAEGRAFVAKVSAAAAAEEERDKKRVLAAEKARKKHEGVVLGMTQQDVLDSQWGRPRKVNRTIGSYGTHEQWVYGGGYLYFENGILRTIQN